MARKKKKGPSENHASGERAVSSPALPVRPLLPLPFLDLKLLTKPTIKDSIANPVVTLAAADADSLGLVPGDEVILLRCLPENNNHLHEKSVVIRGVAIGAVSVAKANNKGITSPGKAEVKKMMVVPGHIHLAPASFLETLLLLETTLMEPTTTTSTERTLHTPLTNPAKSSEGDTPQSSSFSFVGQLSLSPSTPQTPAKGTALSTSMRVTVVPMDSKLGQQVRLHCCRVAGRLHVQPFSKETSDAIQGAVQLLPKLLMAYTMGRYVKEGERLRVSLAGKPIDLTVTKCEPTEPDMDTLANQVASLSVNDNTDVAVDGNEDNALGIAVAAAAAASRRFRLYQITRTTQFEGLDQRQKAKPEDLQLEPKPVSVVGLTSLLERVKSILLLPLQQPELFARGIMQPPRGVLLHGPGGVGKSSLARQVASDLEGQFDVQFVNCASLQSQSSVVGEAERRLSQIFRRSGRGKLLVLDDVHLICPRRGYNPGNDRLAATLLALIDGVKSSDKENTDPGLVILAITNNPSLLDPALRRPGRIDAEMEIPIPDNASTRAEIIKFHLNQYAAQTSSISEQEWLDLGTQAKGFNGADCMLAAKEAVRITLLARQSISRETVNESEIVQVCLEDLKQSVRSTKPSAIKSITVEIPHVKWSSIGGMETVKSELQDAIKLPLEHEALFQKFHVPPPRGVLLYGPPGCSKTLMARALATEGQMNFLAVKGPELLSKWLGESERALSSLFRRARMASPSIIFFDEIDAIGCHRGSGDSASSGRLLSQLLTELDGINHTITPSLSGIRQERVVVVGATNRPDLLDSALTRPGRIDRKIYVGVPDLESRKQIFRIGLQDRSCDDDVDFDVLAGSQLSEGYSGAEIISICREAALRCLDEYQDGTDSFKPIIGMRHLLGAIEATKRQITPKMLDFYRAYAESSRQHLP